MSAAEASPSSCSHPSVEGRADSYARRRPEETLLHRVVREHWPVFRERAEEQGGLPRFVVRDFEEYLGCGLLERGLVHLACSRCGHSMVVAFSCKRRGFCPSCCARRSADVAAHMVDEVFPAVPVRQWVCSLPWSLRTPIGYDRALCADVMGGFARALERSSRRRARKLLGLRSVDDALFGAVTFVQRSDSALRLDPHAHTLALDGVYVRDGSALVFHALPAPSAADVLDVAERTHARLEKVLAERGRSLEAPEEPVLASCYAASAADVELLGLSRSARRSRADTIVSARLRRALPLTRAGQRTTKLVRPVRVVQGASARAHANVDGVDVHAEVAFDGRDRPRLERLVRYVTRPPLATERLEEHDGGRVRYAFKKAWKDGTHAVVLEPLDFIARLAAIVPPPRWHLVRYHGVLAANAAERAEVVPAKAPAPPPPGGEQLPLPLPTGAAAEPKPRTAEPSRHPWSWLLMRVFAADVTTCERPGCGGRMRIVEIATRPRDASRVLFDLGLGPRGPPRIRPTRPAPVGQLSLHFTG